MNKITNNIVVTKDHIKLLKNLNIGYDYKEFGASCHENWLKNIDQKRPYGNSDVFADMGRILNIKPEDGGTDNGDDGYVCYSEQQEDYMVDLHKDMLYILQILVQELKIKPGKYKEINYYKWKRVK